MRFLWDFVIGPVLALLPLRWRRQLPVGADTDWTRAGTASGIYESIGAITGLGYWYMYEMTRRIEQIMDVGDSGRIPGGMNDIQVRGTALTLFYMSLVTWILFYLFFEGVVRFCGAAFTENILGSLPLYVVERLLFWVTKPQEARVGETVKENARSFKESIRERFMVARLESVADELEYGTEGEEEILEIRASRRKDEWVPPRIVRVEEAYFRLEESWVASGARPFCYRLRRLAAGVPGRSVILYRVKEG